MSAIPLRAPEIEESEEANGAGERGKIIGQAEVRFRGLQEELSKEASTMSRTHHEVERFLETEGRDLLRLMYQQYLDECGDGGVGEAIELAGEKKALGETRQREKTLKTVFGEVRVKRQSYSRRGVRQVCPLDEDLSLPERSFSYGVQRQVARHVAKNPFDEAVEEIRDRTGLKMAKKTAEELGPEIVADFDDFYQQRSLQAVRGDSSEILVAAVDCKGVPMIKDTPAEKKHRLKPGEKPNRKRMATVAAVYTVAPFERTADDIVCEYGGEEKKERPKRPPCEHKRVWASLTAGKIEVFDEVTAEMKRRDPRKNKWWVCLTDGESKLQQLALERIGGAAAFLHVVLDIIHVLGYLWDAAQAFYGDDDDERERWVAKYLRMILEGRAERAAAGMVQSATKRGLPKAGKATVGKTAQYIRNNLEFMEYDLYLALGFPIASGAAEGACRNLVKDRLERAGMRWRPEGAEAVLKLRALHLSGDLEEYLEHHFAREHERLYETRRWQAANSCREK